ncbi:hypothetical protein L227DRAFT_95205 [Lentinus tigrinus ALCF2SS1-6]|uniref:Uncharacterized protein n=1 Tax=Lentinus tigrinus ALCF2SS1-6 TaxID=1328759 RepID=A0A5C2SAD3_9APHY|nr:hypothetical protein L227DRAFT_95205 [Lentinus tigrinus ALCF2SS1-6]
MSEVPDFASPESSAPDLAPRLILPLPGNKLLVVTASVMDITAATTQPLNVNTPQGSIQDTPPQHPHVPSQLTSPGVTQRRRTVKDAVRNPASHLFA